MLGLGTQQPRPQGAETPSSGQWFPRSGCLSQSWLEHRRPRRGGLCHPYPSGDGFFSAKPPHVNWQLSLRDAASAAQFEQQRKLCIAVERFTLEGYILIAPINQSRFCHISRSSTETRAVWDGIKCVLKVGHPLLRLCPQEWWMCSISKDRMLSILFIYIFGSLASLVALVALPAGQQTCQLWKTTTSTFPHVKRLIIRRKPLHF